MSQQPVSMLPVEQRTAALHSAVQSMAASGWVPLFVGETQATLRRGKRPNHVLHLLLSLVTVGLWVLVWAWLAIVKHERTVTLTVDAWGNITKR